MPFVEVIVTMQKVIVVETPELEDNSKVEEFALDVAGEELSWDERDNMIEMQSKIITSDVDSSIRHADDVIYLDKE